MWSKIFLALAGSFGALLVVRLVVVARGLYLARHLLNLIIFMKIKNIFSTSLHNIIIFARLAILSDGGVLFVADSLDGREALYWQEACSTQMIITDSRWSVQRSSWRINRRAATILMKILDAIDKRCAKLVRSAKLSFCLCLAFRCPSSSNTLLSV